MKGFSKTKWFFSSDRVLPTSPQAGIFGDLGNIHVSPNDQSLDSQANNDVASDSVVPDLLADHFENCKCDWSLWNHWNAHSMVAIILSITSVKLHLSKEGGFLRLCRWNAVCITNNHYSGPQNRHRSMILKKSCTRLLLQIPRLQWPILLDIQMMMVKSCW